MKEAPIEEYRKIGIPENVAEELKLRLEEQNGNPKS
jgi:excinuclease ABC subunit C